MGKKGSLRKFQIHFYFIQIDTDKTLASMNITWTFDSFNCEIR